MKCSRVGALTRLSKLAALFNYFHTVASEFPENRTPASRKAFTASSESKYVRCGKSMPGELHSRIGKAFASSSLVM